MTRVTKKMNPRKPVYHRTLAVQLDLIDDVRKKTSRQRGETPRKLEAEVRKDLVVDAIVATSMPFDFSPDIQAEVESNRRTRDPK